MTGICRFTIGEFKCTVLSDGSGIFPGGKPAEMMFAAAPQAEAEAALRERGEPTDVMSNQINCLLIDTGEQLLLVDTGLGAASQGGMGILLDSLREAGHTPDEIDRVIISHGHGDHINGLTDESGNLIYPNARFVFWRSEWEHWTDEAWLSERPEMAAQAARKHLPPLKDHLQLVDSESDIVPGVRALPTPGHTPGHLSLLISSGGEHLIYVGDAFLHPLHVEHPEWSAVFDTSYEDAAATRPKLYRRAVETNALLLVYHITFPGLGRIVTDGDGWQWQPEATA